jgi:hypothetical protein
MEQLSHGEPAFFVHGKKVLCTMWCSRSVTTQIPAGTTLMP